MATADRPFIGRKEHLAELHRRMASAAGGGGSAVLLAGPAGIGKTTLVERVLAPAGPPTTRVHVIGRGYCSPDLTAPALFPWQQALAAIARASGTSKTPPLRLDRAIVSSAVDPTGAAASRLQALARVADALLGAAAACPMVIVLEDLQWADKNSVELFGLLASGARETRLLLLATIRESAGPHLVPAGPVGRLPGTTTLRLPPLSRQEVGQYLHQKGGVSATPAAVDRVLRRSGGLPLLLEPAAADTDSAAPVMSEIAAALLGQLTATARRLVEVAALLRQPVPLDLLTTVAQVRGAVGRAALDEACRAGLLSRASAWDGLDEPAFSVVHALLAEAVAAASEVTVRREVHRRAALALQDHPPDTAKYDAAQVATHWLRAGTGTGTLRCAADWSKRAAQEAVRSLAFDQAERHQDAAVEALRQVRADDTELAEAILEQAKLRYLSGHVEQALALCEQAAVHAARVGRGDMLAGAALVVRWVTFPRAVQVVSRLCRAALATPQPQDVASRLMSQLAIVVGESGALDEARRLAADAMELALSSGDAQAGLDAARAREGTLLAPDDVDERLRLAEQALAFAEHLQQPFSCVVAQQWRLRACYQSGRLDEVDRVSQAITGLAAASGLPLARWHDERCRAARAALEGRFDDARESNGRATDLVRTTGDPTAAALSQVFACHLALLRQDPRELPDGFWPVVQATQHIPFLLALRALALLLLDRVEEASADYERASRALRDPLVDARFPGLLVHLVELAHAFGDTALSVRLAEHLRPYAARPGALGMPTVMWVGCAQRPFGRALHRAGAPAEAELALRAALVNDTALGAYPYVVLDRLALAEVLMDGRDAEALPLAQAAAAGARRLSLPGVLARADRLVADLMLRARQHDPLTPREREVALLLLHALPNSRIAERLVLSERTVESHVRSILGKLGFGNRTELVARWKP